MATDPNIRALQAEMLREMPAEVARQVYRNMCEVARIMGYPPPDPFPDLYGAAGLALVKDGD